MVTGATTELRGLTLTVTERCNLRCSYCHARRSGRTMSPAVADAAVDLLMRTTADTVSLSFYGGEPFLEPALLRRVLIRAQQQARPGQQIRCVTPTNGLLLDAAAFALCREHGISLAVSIDGTRGRVERPLASGEDSTPPLLSRISEILRETPSGESLARMTVTPSNVSMLSDNVKSVARLGFERIVYQPAWELDWTKAAITSWCREQHRIVTWLVGARAAGAPAPRLPALEAIESRLLRGKSRRECGMGVKFAAVATDGQIFPCYRFVFEERARDLTLGDVARGVTRSDVRAELASLRADAQHPEEGTCKACPASDGCIHYCPALGYLLVGDLRTVPRPVCRLMQGQVEAVRHALLRPRQSRRRAAASPGWAAAVVAAASTLSAAGCGGITDTGRAPSIDASTDAEADADAQDASADGSMDASAPTDGGIIIALDAAGGVCPIMIDDAGTDGEDPTPGICGGIC